MADDLKYDETSPAPAPVSPLKYVDILMEEAGATIALLFTRVAENDPAEALRIYERFLQYKTPKKSSSELTGADGGPLTVEILKEG